MNKLVMNYLLSKDVKRADTLFFGKNRYTAEIVDNEELEDLVLKVLDMTYNKPSFNATSEIMETSHCRNRSSLDIWRHVKAFRPEETLERVMSALYSLVEQKKSGSMFCSTVSRRVFKSVRLNKDWGSPNMTRLVDGSDEYRIGWGPQWKTIGSEEEV